MAIVAILILAVVWTTVFAAGAGLAVLGLRGRMIDRLPRCRRCDYLLVGFESRPARCPECGAALLGPGRVVVGRRRPRVALSLLGAAMVVAAASPVVMVAPRPARPVVVAARKGLAPPPVPPQSTPVEPVPWGAAPMMAAFVEPEPGPATYAPKGPLTLNAVCARAAQRASDFEGLIASAAKASVAPSRAAPSAAVVIPPAPGVPAPSLVLPRAGIGPLPARGIGGDSIASRIDPRRVGDNRIRSSGPAR